MRSKDKMISGFSKLGKREKIAWLLKHFFTSNPIEVTREFASFWHTNEEAQKMFDGISENTITNFYMPFGVAPNFLINGKLYCVPMVIEESSVVAAASSGAKFWLKRGGFHTDIVSTVKSGHVHFMWHGEPYRMFQFFEELRADLRFGVKDLTCNMEKRGGGIKGIELLHCPEIEEGYYQIKVDFETCDAMGANFINSVLEEFGRILKDKAKAYFVGKDKEVNVIMAILSNYTPECLVRAWVECPIEDLGDFPNNISAKEFAYKFNQAIHIARNDHFRATTHNKGIFNGIDAVVIATGNDFRAIEACGHAYAARDGKYRSLSQCIIEDGVLRFSIEIPLAIGTIGGLTKIHPLARRSLELLGNPSAEELMSIVAAAGLAQNFAAVRSLVTTGIQKGHMKMHLNNILSHFAATPKEREFAVDHFSDKLISFTAVREFLTEYRSQQIAW